jgi:hypothetical protein
MNRRTVVATLGSAALGSIAGCGGGGEEPTEEGTEAATATATATATETATATATATATPAPPTHALDERFVVGEGNEAVPYTVHEFRRSDRIGREGIGEDADGVFLTVHLTIENVRNNTRDVPTGNIVARSEGVRKNVDDGASETAANDDRIDEPSLALATIPGGESRTGVLVYDVPLGNEYRIEFTPTGDAGETHYVDVGPIGEVTDLEEESL